MKVKKKPAELAENPGELRYVDLDLLVDHEDIENRPLSKDHTGALKQSILEAGGIEVPLIAWDGGNPGNQMKVNGEVHPATFLLAGFHRRESLRQIRKEQPKAYKEMFPNGIPVKVKSGDLEEAIATQLRENVTREDPTAEEIFPLIEKLKNDFKLKNKDIAKRVGKSDAWVSEILSIKETLGEEGKEALKSGTGVRELQEAAHKVKKAKKSGKEVSVKEEITKAKAKSAKKKESGRERAEKRLSAKKLNETYKSLPKLKVADRVTLLEAIVDYLAGDTDELPDELQPEEKTQKSKKKIKIGKKK